ncbi:hypothetical protein Nepgr_000998 [Nepenthes gracilis]|uniref:Uncharacterized protein n=1 Tax=Nepenthes gracilis TaxID=150966 RepID=A0AAD3P3R2_NEPGR|nr:hypothetical protein Nepgr_000998 [Nepenthes gracilis]
MPPFPAIKDGPIKLSPVKTTAFRCTKNFIQDHLNVQKIGTVAAGTVPSDSSDGSLAFMSGNENASGHLMDFCGGREMGIPDILCTDFPKNGSFDLCDFDKVEGGSVSFRSLSSLLGFR